MIGLLPRVREVHMDLFARVRERLLDGTLWPLTNDRVLGSHGTGQPCAVCDQIITSAKIEYGGRPGDDRSRARGVLSGVERRESTLRLNSMALSARMLALIQKIEAADAAHFASLREMAKKEKQSEAREKIFARAAKARFKKKTQG
jgi:hypothetical protein